MLTVDTIHLCIRRCASAKDGRGPWQAQKACADTLARTGNPKIAADVAAAARRIGQWLKGAAC
jgi:hypothetical protein